MADDWFQFLRLDVHPLVKTGQTDNIKSPLPGIFPSSGAIRIAILDTGISFPEEAEDIGYTDRIIETKSWLGGSANTDPELERGDLDLDGHGTHAAALLLHVAPDADIYVARVCEGKRELKGRIMADVFHKRVADVGAPVQHIAQFANSLLGHQTRYRHLEGRHHLYVLRLRAIGSHN